MHRILTMSNGYIWGYVLIYAHFIDCFSSLNLISSRKKKSTIVLQLNQSVKHGLNSNSKYINNIPKFHTLWNN